MNISSNTSTEGRRDLGAVIGTTKYRQNYLNEKTDKRIGESRMLCEITWYEQQAAYLCFITGFKHKPTNFMRTIPNISNQPEELDEIIRTEFVPAIAVGINCSDIEKKLLFFLLNWEDLVPNFLRNSRQRGQVFENDLKRFNNKCYELTSPT